MTIVEHASNLYKLRQTRIGNIDLYVEEEALDLIDKKLTRKSQYSIPDEYFNANSLIRFIFKRYKMDSENTEPIT